MNTEKNIRRQLYLAALLHDIGKFYQRGDEYSATKSKMMGQWVKNNEGLLCPKNYKGNYYTHKHVMWTAQFFEDHKDIFSTALGSHDEVMMWAAKHHNPDNKNIFHQIIQKADHWSSGTDRTQGHGKKDAEDEQKGEEKWDNFKRVQMHSIFEKLFRDNDEAPYEYYLPVNELVLDKNLFPKKEKGAWGYTSVWNDFVNEFKDIPDKNIHSFSETLFNLLHKYIVTIPSSTIHLPDVSLFDHSKTVAAFAVCIYDYLLAKNQLKTFDLRSEDEAILLIGGDISGIQAYIYNIISKQAAKNLKGRSFYLQLLVDSVIERIVTELSLYKANIVYASGGGFYLLAANTEDNRNKLDKIEKEISDKIFKEHGISLFLALDAVALSENDICGKLKPNSQHEREPNKISEKWQELIEKLNKKKRSRYADKLTTENGYKYFFEEAEKGAKAEKDIITNEEIQEGEKTAEVEGGLIKQTTQRQIDLGKALRETDYFVKTDTAITHWNKDDFLHWQNPCNLDVHWYFLKKEVPASDDLLVSKLNNTDFISPDFNGNNISYDFSFYAGNKFPADVNGEPFFFDRLAGENDATFRRLGVLRMDVDNLGSAFIKGFSEERRTFSRYTSLSSSLDFFFKGYLNMIWESDEQLKHWTYIVYAGGDDLFIVGKWNEVIRFAEKINEEFRKWTCHNPHLTLSAGIAIVSDKFPILKAAEMAGDAEHKAKEHTIKAGDERILTEKNSFCLLNMPLHWEYEYPIVKALKEKFVKLLAQEKLPSGFLQKIALVYQMRKKQKGGNENESWQWVMAYDFARMKQRKKEDEELKKFIDGLQKDILCNQYNGNNSVSNYSFVELLHHASRWAELERRSQKKTL